MNSTSTDKIPTFAAILAQAADVIDQRGWHQGNYVPEDTDPETAPVCAAAAIHVATGCWPNGRPRSGVAPEDVKAGRKARRELMWHLDEAVTEWNDEPGRTAEQVITAMRECAAKLRGTTS